MGGVGGIDLVTLARLGIGRFTIADPDVFETVNFNRQYGATLGNIGRGKAEVMAEEARAINPDLELRVFNEAITSENVADFLSGVDVLVDGIDFFSIEARRLVFREARDRGIWAVTAGPIGFSTAWLVFDPDGMSFDRYFDLHDGMDRLDQLIAFAVGLTPRATHLRYLDLTRVNPQAATGPSAALACHLASGVAAAETLKILLDRGPLRPAPWYFQFDAHRHVLCKGRLHLANRHPWQRYKRWRLNRSLAPKNFYERGKPDEGTTGRTSG
jgi:molybdopterin/thiamine biosynthesis adenylyltransferase